MKLDHKSLYPIAMKLIGYPSDTDPASLPSSPMSDQFQRFLDQMTALKKTGRPERWVNRVICRRCRHENHDAPFEARRENTFKVVCGECGAAGQFIDSVERWWSLSVWWRPSTWGVGYWESKD